MWNMKQQIEYALDPVKFAREVLAFAPDRWQAEVLAWEGQRLILNCCRQSGKSTVSAILAVHAALFKPGSLILLVSPSQRQSSELFKKIAQLLAMVPDLPRKTEDNRLSIAFDNDSRVVSLPSQEATVRGFSSPSMVICDEASRISDDLYFSLRPMLAVGGGKLILLSTPFGKRGFFFHEWKDGGDSWKQVEITADQVPRITQKFLDEELNVIGPWFYEQEYFCKFKEDVSSLFTYEQVMGALDDDLEPLAFDFLLPIGNIQRSDEDGSYARGQT